MNNEQEQIRARKNCGKLHRKLFNGCDLIMDDEKYFETMSLEIATSIQLTQLQLLQKSTVNVKTNLKQR